MPPPPLQPTPTLTPHVLGGETNKYDKCDKCDVFQIQSCTLENFFFWRGGCVTKGIAGSYAINASHNTHARSISHGGSLMR